MPAAFSLVFVRSLLRHTARALGYGALGVLITLVVVLVIHMNGRPDLRVWHTADLDAEFDADSPVSDFAGYQALEDRLFRQLDALVYDAVAPADRSEIDRYSRGSLADPGRWPHNWNRSFEFEAEAPRAGVLLIHGMSDSPYSMRSLAEILHANGAWVVGLRVPGHGTAPSGLVDVEWTDMAAAVRLGMAHLGERVGDRPLVMVGYSNGGALSVLYALDSLENEQLVTPDRLILLSPEIGITKFAALAVWQERLGRFLGLDKLDWNSILPEYDPYKYGSFALNAGKQAYRLTEEIQSRIVRLGKEGRLEAFPTTIAFQSVVDATVSARALVARLFDPLTGGDHELVLFDINRSTDVEPLLKRDPDAWLRDMLDVSNPTFTVSVVMNERDASRAVVVRRRLPDQSEIDEVALGLAWPPDVYSLSHVALPFPPNDPVYGGPDAAPSPGIALGQIALRGERGVLQISANDMLRLRWNPFHAYIAERAVGVLDEVAAAPR